MLTVVIQHYDNRKPDYWHTLMGDAPSCSECKNSMMLVINEGTHTVSSWWYCKECSITKKLSIESGEFI